MVFTTRWILKPQQRKKNKKQTKKLSYSHIASKMRKNRSEFAFLTVCRCDIYNIIFVSKMLHIFPIKRIVQNNFQITVHIGIRRFEVSIIFDGLICFFLAAQFGIWIGWLDIQLNSAFQFRVLFPFLSVIFLILFML